jgi:hypothetical protein
MYEERRSHLCPYQTIPRAREGLFTVASTVCEVFAEKLRNSAQGTANQPGSDQPLKTHCATA